MLTNQRLKDSGVAYIGSIPDDWDMLRASMLFSENKQTNSDLISTIPVQFKFGEIIEKPIDVDDKVKEEIKRYIVVKQDDIMVNGLNLNYDFLTQRVAIVKRPGCITPAYISMSVRSKIMPMYACYLLKALDGRKVLNGWGTGIRLTLNFSEFKKYYLPVPSQKTQQQIVVYLDKETEKIDHLIAMQERLLVLLEEKRQATITHAVTGGRTNETELTETGIEWIDKIPANWRVARIKDLFTANDEALSQKTDPNYQFDYVDISSVDKYLGITKQETLTFEKAPSRARRIVRAGDIIIGAVRTYLEAIAQIDNDNSRLIVSTGFVVLRPKNKVDTDYYIYALRSGAFMASVVANSEGVSYPAINADKLMALYIPVPPPGERLAIAKRCEIEMKQMDKLKVKIKAQIELLKERRISLISNVVTGKVKV